MRKNRWIALALVLALLLTACNAMSFEDMLAELNAQLVTPFSQMQYTRPDMDKMRSELEACCAMAETETDKDALMEQVWTVYGLYNTFHTQYNLACIYYFRDMTDTHWESEYNFCMQNAGNADAMLEEMFYALAASPLKDALEKDPAIGEGFFDDYMGESVWDETFLALLEQEASLEEKYYGLCTRAQAVESYSDEFFESYGEQMGAVFVDLVKVRQKLAAHAGYKDYPSFAYDFYHYRDYTPRQAEKYLREIRDALVPMYRQVEARGGSETAGKLCTEKEAFAYAQGCAQAMGGAVYNAFRVMETAGLYDLTYSERKYNGSFEVYLTAYATPFVFVSPTATQGDKLTFLHEFGHFCSDYMAGGSYAGVDVAEVFSQGMEYLSLCYGPEAGALEEMKMVDCLRVYVEQAAYALFEQQVYMLEGEELTAENVYALYERIGTQFGFDSWNWDSRDFVLIGHFYSDPMYLISYVVSNDAALQLYQMEKAEAGTGLTLFTSQLATEQTYFLAFLEDAGLESPFAAGRVAEVKKTLEKVLG